jgi:P-type Ca2+ transporter type 2C
MIGGHTTVIAQGLGWSRDGRRHILPGRLLLAVEGLKRNGGLGAFIVAQLQHQPAVRAVTASALTGRVLVHFNPAEAEPAALEAMILTLAVGGQAVAAGRELVPETGEIPESTGASEGPRANVPVEQWHAVPLPDLLRQLETAMARGLAEGEAARRLEEYGPNQLRSARQAGMTEVVLQQLKNPITLLLLGAGGLSLAVAQWLEAVAALGIACLTTYLGVRQETRASHALASLSKLAAPRAVVVRGGSPESLAAELLVPGDLIILEEGDRVPADARLVLSSALQVDESALTGESCPVLKDPNMRCQPATPLADRNNMVYAGTTVVSGRAQAVVVATAMQTEVGKVATLLEEGNREVTPLQRRLQHLARWIFWGILGIGAAGTAVAMARGLPLGAALAQSVSVAVSAMPQGLPVTVTIALSTAVTRLAEQGAMTRRLGAMECLGSTTVICTDKTGTLTCNRLSVRELRVAGARWALDGSGQFRHDGDLAQPDQTLLAALEAAALCNNARLLTDGGGWKAEGDATEGALLIAARHAGIDPAALQAERPRLHEVPFTAEQRRMSVVCQAEGGPVLYVKGAPETVLPMCSRYLGGPDGDDALTSGTRQDWRDAAEQMASQGLRVLAVASRPQDQPVFAAEKGLTVLGFIGMVDAPRPGVRVAIERCRDAGIRVVMLTGDHPATAAAIGREVGILRSDGVVLTGPQLDAMSDADLAGVADKLAVCARVAPEHKLRVVRLLKGQGHVVAMTGDGVNDAPALQAADTGIAMGVAGTEVTRGAANLVLTNDDFTSIVRAVEQGRSAYGNIRRALTYSLTTNGGEALMALLPLAVGLALPVPAAMLLITNMLCDGLVSLSLATDPPEPGGMKRPPRPLGEPVLGHGTLGAIAVRGAAIGLTTVGLYSTGVALSGLPSVGYSMALAGLVGAKLLFAWQVRRRSLDGVVVSPGPNRLLTLATVLGGGVTLAAIYVPGLSRMFAMAPLDLISLALVAGTVWVQDKVAGSLSHRWEPAPSYLLPEAV